MMDNFLPKDIKNNDFAIINLLVEFDSDLSKFYKLNVSISLLACNKGAAAC